MNEHACATPRPRRRSFGPVALALTIGCALGVPARAGADAETAAFVISLSGCDEIDRAALLSLLELELSDVAGGFRRSEPPFVELVCVGEQLHIQVRDPVTGKRIGRTVPRPPAEHGERSVALAVSQLFLTSWLELLLPAPARAELPDPPAGAYAAVARRAREALSTDEAAPPPPRDPSRTIGLDVFGGGGVRDVAAPVLTQALALSAQVALDRTWALTIAVGLEHGVASRERGGVELWLGDVGLGADLTLVRDGALTIGLGAHGGVVWSRLAGQPSRNDVRGDSAEGVGARIALAPRVGLELDGFVISLAVEAGVDLGLPIGLVKDERAVTAGGFFGRALLGVGVRFGD